MAARSWPRAAPRVGSGSRRSDPPFDPPRAARVVLTPLAPATPRGSRAGTRQYRLRGDRAFETVFRTGVRFDGRFLQLVAAPADHDPGRVGYIIGRRSIPLAVDRNRLRRRLRVAIVAARPAASRYDVILRVRQPIARKDILAAAGEGAALLQRLLAGTTTP